MRDGVGDFLDLGRPSIIGSAGASTRAETNGPKMTRLRRPQLARRRKAPPAKGARHFGPYTPVTLTLRVTRGAVQWVEVTTPAGRFHVNYDAGVYDLIQQIIRGGHWVT